MEKIVLYKSERPDISIIIEIYFNDQGQLIFEGQDIGKSVAEFWGDSDYEYSYTVDASETKKLFHFFGITDFDEHELLIEIKKRFGGNGAYSKFGEFMRNNNINYTSFSW